MYVLFFSPRAFSFPRVHCNTTATSGLHCELCCGVVVGQIPSCTPLLCSCVCINPALTDWSPFALCRSDNLTFALFHCQLPYPTLHHFCVSLWLSSIPLPFRNVPLHVSVNDTHTHTHTHTQKGESRGWIMLSGELPPLSPSYSLLCGPPWICCIPFPVIRLPMGERGVTQWSKTGKPPHCSQSDVRRSTVASTCS